MFLKLPIYRWDFLVLRELGNAQREYGISSRTAGIIFYLPLAIILLYLFFFLFPFTRRAALLSLEENHPVELLTFIALFFAAAHGFRFVLKLWREGRLFYIAGFYLFLSFGLFIIALEEIAWGQQFFGFDTPLFLENINIQKETTLHNIDGLQGHSEMFRLLFGILAFAGLGLSKRAKFKSLACPRILIFWVLIITVHAAVDVFNDYIAIQQQFDAYMQRTSELIEMMIGMCAFLYIYLNAKLMHRNGVISTMIIS